MEPIEPHAWMATPPALDPAGIGEAHLVRRALQGNQAALESLLAGHQQPVYRIAYLLAGDPEKAEDIAPKLRPFSIGIGPDRSHNKASPKFLHLWLKDSKTTKPETLMPNLGLTPAEIDALIAFLLDEN